MPFGRGTLNLTLILASLTFATCSNISPATPAAMRLLPGEDLFTDIVFSGDEHTLYVEASNGSVYVYSIPEMKLAKQGSRTLRRQMRTISDTSRRGCRYRAVADFALGSIRLTDFRSGQSRWIDLENSQHARISPGGETTSCDGAWLASGDGWGKTWLFAIPEGDAESTARVQPSMIIDVTRRSENSGGVPPLLVFSKTGHYIAATQKDAPLLLFDVNAGGALLATLPTPHH